MCVGFFMGNEDYGLWDFHGAQSYNQCLTCFFSKPVLLYV
jgi:hypothetical protein